MIEKILIGAIVCGAFYLLYRYFGKNSGYCAGCNSQDCPTKRMSN